MCGVVPSSPTCDFTHLLCPLPARFSQCRHWAWTVDCRGGVDNSSRTIVQVKMFILLPSGGCQLIHYIHTVGSYRHVAIAGSCSRPGCGKARLTRYWMLVSGQVQQGSTLYRRLNSGQRCGKLEWILVSGQVDWRLARGRCVEGPWATPLHSLPTPAGGGGGRSQLAKHCLLPLICTNAQSVLHRFLLRV